MDQRRYGILGQRIGSAQQDVAATERNTAMIIADFTVTFTVLVLQIIAGAIAAAVVGRVVQGGFGLIGDLLFGVIGAIGANFLVSNFNLFNVNQYGLPGALILAIIGSILLVVIVHLVSGRRARATA